MNTMQTITNINTINNISNTQTIANSDREYFIDRCRYDQLTGSESFITFNGSEIDPTLPIDMSVGAFVYSLTEGGFAVVKNRMPGSTRNYYSFPKGGPNKNETDMLSVMKRELYEETGINLDDSRCDYEVKGIVQIVYKSKRIVDEVEFYVNRVIMFYILILNTYVELCVKDMDEIEECRWTSVFATCKIITYHLRCLFLEVVLLYYDDILTDRTKANIEKLALAIKNSAKRTTK